MSPPDLEAVSRWVGRTFDRAVRLTGGSSRAMYLLHEPGRDQPSVVLRMDQGGVFGTPLAEEVRLMTALDSLGVPVAPVVADDTSGEVLGRPAFAMDFLTGDPGPPTRAGAAAITAALRELHDVDPGRVGLAEIDQIERWLAVARSAGPEPHPLLVDAARWLADRRPPPPTRPALVHGDAGPGNAILRDGRVVALTDWEFTHAGDPDEDWVFQAAMRGQIVTDEAGWRELYREQLDLEIDPDRWRWWTVFNLFKGSCANLTAYRVVADGSNRRPDMVIVGGAIHQLFLRRLTALIDEETR